MNGDAMADRTAITLLAWSSDMHAGWRVQFLSRVEVVDDETSCWLWTGSRLPKGYGRFYPEWKVGLNAHRVSWEMANGRAVPRGLDVMHSCDNPPCVRPSHLSPGTKQANMQDAVAKGRAVNPSFRGEAHPSRKLTEADVRYIRAAMIVGEGPTALAHRFKVSRKTIQHIQSGQAWRHVQ